MRENSCPTLPEDQTPPTLLIGAGNCCSDSWPPTDEARRTIVVWDRWTEAINKSELFRQKGMSLWRWQ
jgi:hypothetical protein